MKLNARRESSEELLQAPVAVADTVWDLTICFCILIFSCGVYNESASKLNCLY